MSDESVRPQRGSEPGVSRSMPVVHFDEADPRLVTDERAADEVAESWLHEPFFADLLYTRAKLIEALDSVIWTCPHTIHCGDIKLCRHAQARDLLAEMRG